MIRENGKKENNRKGSCRRITSWLCVWSLVFATCIGNDVLLDSDVQAAEFDAWADYGSADVYEYSDYSYTGDQGDYSGDMFNSGADTQYDEYVEIITPDMNYDSSQMLLPYTDGTEDLDFGAYNYVDEFDTYMDGADQASSFTEIAAGADWYYTDEQDASLGRILRWEDDNVIIRVRDIDTGAIPAEAEMLLVTPIQREYVDTEQSFLNVENELGLKLLENERVSTGFLAYRIKVADIYGNELPTYGKFAVSMEYKEPVIPDGTEAEVDENGAIVSEYSVKLFQMKEATEEYAAEVLDLQELEQLNDLDLTERKEVNKFAVTVEDADYYILGWDRPTEIVPMDTDGEEYLPEETLSDDEASEEIEFADVEAEVDPEVLDTEDAEETDGEEVLEEENSDEESLEEDAIVAEDDAETDAEDEEDTEDSETVELEERVLTWENDDVIITVKGTAEDVIPSDVESLLVVPILKDDAETAEQYQEVEAALQEKAQQEENEIAGFLAYDIKLVNVDGEVIEPTGTVSVSIEYKHPVLPAEVDPASNLEEKTGEGEEPGTEASETDDEVVAMVSASEGEAGSEDQESAPEAGQYNISVIHMKSDEAGNISNLIDMNQNNQVEELTTTEAQEVEKVAFATDSFSYYIITWGKPGEVVVPQEGQTVFTWENDDVTITATAEEGVIPAEVKSLQVLPIVKGEEETAEQYEEVAAQLEEHYGEVAGGFLAYDIALADEEGNEIEPNGEVKVVISYKEAAMPEEVKEQLEAISADEIMEAEVSVEVLHFKEDENGEVEEIQNLADETNDSQIETMDVDEEHQIQEVGFVVDSFSLYAVLWDVSPYLEPDNYIIYAESKYVDASTGVTKSKFVALKNANGTAGIHTFDDVTIKRDEKTGKIVVNSKVYTENDNQVPLNIIWYGGELQRDSTKEKMSTMTWVNAANQGTFIELEPSTKDDDGNVTLGNVIGGTKTKLLARPATDSSAYGYTLVNWDSTNQKDSTCLMFLPDGQGGGEFVSVNYYDNFNNSTSPYEPVYFASVLREQDETKTVVSRTVNTADTRSEGVKINIFDYGVNNNFSTNVLDRSANHYTSDNTSGINDGHSLRFYGYGQRPDITQNNGRGEQYNLNTAGNRQDNESIITNKPRAIQGIVDNKLHGDYPFVNANYASQSGESLSYLFDLNGNSNKKVYADVNHLLVGGNGTYSYDSNLYYGQYMGGNSGGGNFELTQYSQKDSQTGQWDSMSNYQIYKSQETETTQTVGFFPFNEPNVDKKNVEYDSSTSKTFEFDHYEPGSTQQQRWVSTGWNQGYWETYWTKTVQGYYDHHFGLTMEANFALTEDKQWNGNDIIFHFSGDDDMWVFVDGVLVLDIGGIHEPISGTINFTQDSVKVSNAVTVGDYANNTGSAEDTSISAKFQAAGKTWSSDPLTLHEIKVFYLERGGIYSNLALEINLPVTRTIDFMKQISKDSDVDQDIYDYLMSQPFSFEIYTDEYTKYTYPLLREVEYSGSGQVWYENADGVMEEYPKDITYIQGYQKSFPAQIQRYSGEQNPKYYIPVLPDSNGVYTIKPEWKLVVWQFSGNIHHVQEVNSGEFDVTYLIGTTDVEGDPQVDPVYPAVIDPEVKDIKVGNKLRSIDIPVEKIWENGDPPAGTTIEVYLYADGELVKTSDAKFSKTTNPLVLPVTLDDGTTSWKGYFTDLPRYKVVDNGGKKELKAIKYTIQEKAIDDYKSYYDESTLIDIMVRNTFSKALPSGYDDIKVTLVADGVDQKTVSINSSNKWEYVFGDLPKFDQNGNTINYTLTYNPTDVTVDDARIEKPGFKITNGLDTDRMIRVKKTFEGLTDTQIQTLLEANNFNITVTHPDENNNTHTDTLTLPSTSYKERGQDSDGNWYYIWELPSHGDVTYNVAEGNYAIANFTLTSKLNGTDVTASLPTLGQVKPSASSMEWSNGTVITMQDSGGIYKAETGAMDDTSIMVIRIPVKDGQEKTQDVNNSVEYLVWTKKPLGVNDRLKALQLINGSNGAAFPEAATEGNTFFLDESSFTNVSGEQWRWNWNEINYDSNTKKFSIEGAHLWDIKTFTYSNPTDDDIEIRVVNKYVENTIPLDLMKYGSGTNALTGANFKLEYRKETVDNTTNPATTTYSWEPCTDAVKGQDVSNGVYVVDIDNKNPDFDNMKAGIFRLTEVVAPSGFVLLKNKIYFKIENQQVKLVSYNEQDDTVTEISDGTAADMWWVRKEKINNVDTFQINIRNEVLYSLPSTGGIGIYWYMIGGVLLMMAAALVYITNRRRGVLNG